MSLQKSPFFPLQGQFRKVSLYLDFFKLQLMPGVASVLSLTDATFPFGPPTNNTMFFF